MKARAYTLPILAVLLAANAVAAQSDAGKRLAGDKKEIPLYPGAAPGAEKWDWSERTITNPRGQPVAMDVVRPVLLHYPAERSKAVGTAMIVAPGGGFRALMMSYEGDDIARRLNAMGIDAFVLKYRLLYTGPGAPRSPARGAPAAGERPRRFTLTGAYKAQAGQDIIKLAADDGQQAVRLVRERAGEFGVRPSRIGMIGFSAGGMVTSEALFGPAATRPDFAAIIYGVGEIKETPSPAPPLFLAVSADDVLAAGRTVELFTAYRKDKGPAELHIFQMGAQGFVNKGGGADHFMDRLEEWLRVNKLLSQPAAGAQTPSGRRGFPGVGRTPELADTDTVFFNGKDLEGWEGLMKYWSVKDGAIVGYTPEDPRHNTFLCSKKSYKDFELKFKVRLKGGVGNSGVQFRTAILDREKFTVRGPQCDIGQQFWGSLVGEQMAPLFIKAAPGDLIKKVVKPNDFNDYAIKCVGKHVTIQINGETTVDGDFPNLPEQGIIAWQLHAGFKSMEVTFKDIQFTNLSPVRATTATPAAALKVAKDFRAELLYSVPKDRQGSWVNLTVDPRGRLIVSDQNGGLYRITPPPVGSNAAAAKIEKLDVALGGAHGLLWAFDSLYVMVNERVNLGEVKPSNGLHRVRSKDGGNTFEKPEFLHEIQGRGEHGAHAVVLSPDGKSLFVVCGNDSKLVSPLAGSRVPQLWGEDRLFPLLATFGGVKPPAGCIYKTDPDGKNWELWSVGYRNAFDLAFNRHGDLFTYDSDMEWDMNTPWYRPTRVCLATSGSEFGFRNGSDNSPPRYVDTLPAICNVGPGSPTGMTFGYGARFPARYQEALYLCDWSYGKIYALHLTPAGSAYQGELEEFLNGAPLPVTDAIVNPADGALYFTTGGRRTQSGLYRVSYVGKEPAASAKSDNRGADARALRRRLEAFHGRRDPQAVETAWPYLSHDDRYIRFAARVAIEHQDPKEWQERALNEANPTATINALLALVRAVGQDPVSHPRKTTGPLPGAERKAPILQALDRLDPSKLSESQRSDLLRVYTVLFNRLGGPDPAARERLIGRLDPLFPAKSYELNADLCEMLVYLEAPGVAAKALKLLAEAPTQEEQLEYAKSLRMLRTGWTPAQRKEYFAWYQKAASYKGGQTFRGTLSQMKRDAVARLTAQEKEDLKTVLEAKPATTAVVSKPRPFVKSWKLDELAPRIEAGLTKRDFDRGRRLFGEAQCFSCHRFDNEGGAQAPDLTIISGRYSVRDLLEKVLDPDKAISDQYAATVFTLSDGRVVTGRIVNYFGDRMSVLPNMLDPNALVNVSARNVESQERSKTSMMPKGLLDSFHEDEILDLAAYLLSRGDRNHPMFQVARTALPQKPAAVSGKVTPIRPDTAPGSEERTQMYAEMKWRMIGPFRGGRTVGATGVPGQPNLFYIGVNNGGVWKTIDYGHTWKPIFDDQPTGSIGALAVAPSKPDVIYVGCGEGLQRPDLSVGDGMYKSTDGGKTWKHIGLRDGQQIPAILVDPRNPERVFVAVLGHPYGANPERGVFRSTDGGKSWEKVLYKDENTGAVALAFDPSNAQTVYAALWSARQGPWENGAWQGSSSGLFKSTDGGTTWQPLTKGLPTANEGLGRIGFDIAPNDPKRMYALVDARQNGGLYRSEDAGESWKHINSDRRVWGRGSDFAEVKVDPKNKNIVYSANITLLRSTDGGASFTVFKGAPGGDDYHTVWINPDDPKIILTASDQGAVITVNGGQTWSSWYNQPSSQFYHVITDNQFPYWVYGGQQESGSAAVSSRGRNGQITFRDWHPVGVEEYGYVAPDPLHPNLIYGGKVSCFDSATGQVREVGPAALRTGKYRFLRTAPLVFSTVDPHALYLGANVLFKTTNGGHSWDIISPDLTREAPDVPESIGIFRTPQLAKQPRRGVIYTVAPSYKDADVVWCGTDDGLIHMTRDGGKNWTNVTPPGITSWSKISILDAGRFDAATAYAAVNRFRLDDLRPHIYRTHDGGKSWTPIVKGLPHDPVNTVREDPVRKGLLFAGTERAVYVSFNDGDDWHPLRLNMPATSIRDLVVHNDDVVVGTHGRSFWILDDITPLRQINAEVAAADAFLFKPQLTYRVRNNLNTDTPLPPEEPGGKNPPDGAILNFFLKTDAKTITLEVFDTKNDLVRRYSSADKIEPVDEKALAIPTYWIRPPQILLAKAGMHRFIWDLHYPPAEGSRGRQYGMAAIYRDTPAGPFGPWVHPGEYTVKLTVDGRGYTQPLTVKMDPRVQTPAADLEKQFQISMRCYEGMRQIRTTLTQTRRLRDQLKTAREHAREDDLRETLAAFDRKVTALEGDLTPRFRPGMVRSADARPTLGRLSGELSAVMRLVQEADAKPTTQTLAAFDQSIQTLAELLARWEDLRTKELNAVNEKLQKANLSALTP